GSCPKVLCTVHTADLADESSPRCWRGVVTKGGRTRQLSRTRAVRQSLRWDTAAIGWTTAAAWRVAPGRVVSRSARHSRNHLDVPRADSSELKTTDGRFLDAS